MILYSLFIRSSRFLHQNDTLINTLITFKAIKTFSGVENLIRQLPNAEAEQMFLERVILKFLFDF